MNRIAKRMIGLGAAALAVSAISTGALADKVEDFYKGKQLRIVVGYGPGGGYAVYCRQILKYFAAAIPGKPNVVCQFMPGGGGLRAANYMYNAGPRDGSAVMMISDYVGVAQLLRPKKVKYDARKFKWIGVMVPANPVILAWHTAKVKKFDDVFKTELVVGLTGPLAQGGLNTSLMNKFLGTKFKRVIGYKSTGKVALAVEQGEVEATMSSWISLKARKFQMIKEGKYIPIVQVGMTKAKDLPNVPLMRDYAKDDQTRAVLDITSAAAPFGRSIAVPPNFPKYLLAGLRTAFDNAVKDPEFLRTAKERHIEIDPATGASLDPVLEKLLNTPKEIVALARKAVGAK
jgi:tripartite-type tricarboxylate transporter receptor subunit TctC